MTHPVWEEIKRQVDEKLASMPQASFERKETIDWAAIIEIAGAIQSIVTIIVNILHPTKSSFVVTPEANTHGKILD